MAKEVWLELARYARSITRASKDRRQGMIHRLLGRSSKMLATSANADVLTDATEQRPRVGKPLAKTSRRR